ncbi:MAG: sigma 54-interacting transcriptional regulator [Candidatus Eisenbacteria bacterium]
MDRTIVQILELADVDIEVEAHASALDRLLLARQEVLDPQGVESFLIERRVALCLERLGQAEEARAAARHALEQASPDVPTIERARCLLVAGKAAFELGQLTDARAEAVAALAALGDDESCEEAIVARNLLGTVAFRSGNPEMAREQFESALEMARKRGDLQALSRAYGNLGNLHKLRCDWERATEHYQIAYYLGTTQGDSRSVAAAAQNLGILLTCTGRYGEARGYIDRAHKLAAEMGDATRVLRAQIARVQLHRFEYHTRRAFATLESCLVPEQKLPERESCLLQIENAWLHLCEAEPEKAAAVTRELRLRAEAMAPRGDIMIETLLLEFAIAARSGAWDQAEACAAEAVELAREDRARGQEEEAQKSLAIARARRGRLAEAEESLRSLSERHRMRGEWPAYARILGDQARIACEVRGDHEAALALLQQAADLHRRMGLARGAALDEAGRAACLIHLGRGVDALHLIQSLHSFDEGEEPFPLLSAELTRLSDALLRSRASEGGETAEGLKAHQRIEHLLGLGAPWEKLAEILALARTALDVDTIFLAREAAKASFEILAFAGQDPGQGRRVVAAARLGLDGGSFEGAGARIDLEGGAAGQIGSRFWIPMPLHGKKHVLCIRRTPAAGRGPMSRAERNYAITLAGEIARALELGSPDQEVAQLSSGVALADVITQDPGMLRILELIRRIGDTGLNVLLQGETGTGKKLLAHAIHRASGRRNRPFVTVDCAALPETLLEAELFGYRKGAFTGATQDRTGLLAEAAGGTVFLDEIDKSGLTVQRRFLHLLDSGEVRPVGSTTYLRLDVRIVCATSCPDLRVEVAEGRFLKDLYYRLNDISIQVPPLRERRADILLLAGCFVETFAAQTGRKIAGMTSGFRRALIAHDWPGNVRELEKAIRRAVTLADEGALLTHDLLPKEVLDTAVELPEAATEDLKSRVEMYERREIERALESCDGNKSRAAAMLGLSRKGLKGKIARYRIGRRFPQGG